MRKWGIAFLAFAFVGILFVTLAPYSHAEYYAEENGSEYEYHMWLFFNGRIKISVTVDGVTQIATLGDAIWLYLGTYPTESVVLIAVGIGFALLGGLYKTVVPIREDKRVFTFSVLIGGGLGLTGTLLFVKFNNTIIPTADLAWGYYCSIVVFSIFILIGVITIYDSLKNPIAQEEDAIEEYTDLLK